MCAQPNGQAAAGFDPDAEALLDEMDRRSEEIGEGAKYGRQTQRVRYRRPRTRVQVRRPAGGVFETELYTRNLSVGGLGALHAGELPREAAAMVTLVRPGGEEDRLPAKIVYCQRATDQWWTIGMKFDSSIDPSLYLDH